jgi:siderophore synthetase component
LARADAALESRLWSCVGSLLQTQRALLDNPLQLEELCAGAPLPSKENFMTRLMMRADRDAGYTALPNPLANFDASICA